MELTKPVGSWLQIAVVAQCEWMKSCPRPHPKKQYANHQARASSANSVIRFVPSPGPGAAIRCELESARRNCPVDQLHDHAASMSPELELAWTHHTYEQRYPRETSSACLILPRAERFRTQTSIDPVNIDSNRVEQPAVTFKEPNMCEPAGWLHCPS